MILGTYPITFGSSVYKMTVNLNNALDFKKVSLKNSVLAFVFESCDQSYQIMLTNTYGIQHLFIINMPLI
jgi:hypothetical protein